MDHVLRQFLLRLPLSVSNRLSVFRGALGQFKDTQPALLLTRLYLSLCLLMSLVPTPLMARGSTFVGRLPSSSSSHLNGSGDCRSLTVVELMAGSVAAPGSARKRSPEFAELQM